MTQIAPAADAALEPTPNADTLPRRLADFATFADAVDYAAQGARGLARGQIYARDGRLVASTAQEGLIRVLPEAWSPN